MAVTVQERKLLLDGEWIETGDWQDVNSPYSGETVARVARAGAEHARKALDAAEHAMTSPLPAHERAAILDRVAALLKERHDEVAQTISAEAGKPLKAARVEAERAVSTYTMAATEARRLAGDVVPMDASPAGVGKVAYTMRVPIGIVGAITPFNFPLNLVAHKIAPALAAGCAVVLKPAGQTPLSALLLGELETEAGLPPGWLNVLVGPSAEIGDVIVEDERVKLITFTGSSGVGWKIRERAVKKRVNLELGNATPVVVEADADIEEAATKLAANAFSFAGQSCISVQRIYIQRSAYDDFVGRFIPKVQGLKVGDPAEEDTDVGPVIDEDARERIVSWVEEAKSAGATVRLRFPSAAGTGEAGGRQRDDPVAGGGDRVNVDSRWHRPLGELVQEAAARQKLPGRRRPQPERHHAHQRGPGSSDRGSHHDQLAHPRMAAQLLHVVQADQTAHRVPDDVDPL